MENHPRCSVKTLMHAKVLQECLRHAAKLSQFSMCPSGNLWIAKILYWMFVARKSTTPTMSIAMFQEPGHGVC